MKAVSPEGPAIATSFNLTFVCKDNIDIFPVSKDKIDQRILYNCGDNDFSFAVSGYFNGPNYELQQGEGSKFFNFTRKEMHETFSTEFDFSQCKSSFAIPASDGNLVLICINNQTQEIWSYSYDRDTSKITQTNVIKMPFTEFLGSAVDMNARRLILFTKT